MRDHRSVTPSQPSLILGLVAAAALALAIPAAACAEEDHGVEVLLPPSYNPAQESSAADPNPAEPGPSEEVTDGAQSQPPIIVITAAPPPVPGWERPPEIEVVGLEHAGEVVVYSPAPEPMPGWRKLRGVDIRYHGIAEAPAPSRITIHSWKPDAPTRIAYDDWRSGDGTRIPYSRTGSARVAQSWNPYGARFQPSRIRYHGWTRGRGDEL